MIIDASALLAIVLMEPEAPAFAEHLSRDVAPCMSAVNFLEVAIRVDRAESVLLSQTFEVFLDAAAISIEPVTLAQARIARRAYARFGKGRHRAGLNFGDCFAYALAMERGLPLLFKGDDFCWTDVPVAA